MSVLEERKTSCDTTPNQLRLHAGKNRFPTTGVRLSILLSSSSDQLCVDFSFSPLPNPDLSFLPLPPPPPPFQKPVLIAVRFMSITRTATPVCMPLPTPCCPAHHQSCPVRSLICQLAPPSLLAPPTHNVCEVRVQSQLASCLSPCTQGSVVAV